MPFKQGKTPAAVAKRVDIALTQALPKDLEAALYAMYTILGGTADYYVPVDTTMLVQSRTYRIRKMGQSWILTYGYYTDYAAALHENNNWLPAAPGIADKKGGGYNPNAQYDWMNLAWREAGDEALAVAARMIEPK